MANSTKISRQQFNFVFQLSKKIVFEVHYYQLKGNKEPYFSTRAAMFNQPKTDYIQCGQAQESLLPEFKDAYQFYKKWDSLHLSALTKKQITDILSDIEILKSTYNYIDNDQYSYAANRFHFHTIKALSMQPLPKKGTKYHPFTFDRIVFLTIPANQFPNDFVQSIKGHCDFADRLFKEDIYNPSNLDDAIEDGNIDKKHQPIVDQLTALCNRENAGYFRIEF